MQIEIHGHHFVLLPQKAIYWEETQTLLVSDLHLGKITHFRKAGIALPSNALENNFHRLDELLSRHDIKRILFLGDLIHHAHNKEWVAFADWRQQHQEIHFQLVLGNHDRFPKSYFDDAQIEFFQEWREHSFFFIHQPRENPKENEFIFAGHIHPVFCLRTSAKQSMRLPCFIVDEYQAILPSFGIFTGGYEMKPLPGRQVFVIADQRVHKV